jgi:hypothetical protein
LSMQPSDPSMVKSLFFRLSNIKSFTTTYVEYSQNKGYLLLFMYEMMHERIVAQFRSKTNTTETTALNMKEIQARHNETLACIVRSWKLKVKNPKDNAIDVRVSFLFKLSDLYKQDSIVPWISFKRRSCPRPGVLRI